MCVCVCTVQRTCRYHVMLCMCGCVGVCVRCNQFPNVDISRIRHCDTILLTARFVMKTRAGMGEGGGRGGGWGGNEGQFHSAQVLQ